MDVRRALLLLASQALAGLASATPTIVVASPSPGDLTDTRPQFSILFSSDDPGAPIAPATFVVTGNMAPWTGLFAVVQNTNGVHTATYIPGPDDPLEAGPFLLSATVSDTNGVQASITVDYEVVPRFVVDDLSNPLVRSPGDTLDLHVVGLAHEVFENLAVFPGLNGTPIEVPFSSVDLPNDRGTVVVPNDFVSGPLIVRIAAATPPVNASPSRWIHRKVPIPACGAGQTIKSHPDGGFVVLYATYSYDPQGPCNLAGLATAPGYDVVVRYSPVGIGTLLGQRLPAPPSYDRPVGFAIDKSGLSRVAVVVQRHGQPGTYQIYYPCSIPGGCGTTYMTTTIPSNEELYFDASEPRVGVDFDALGNLHFLTWTHSQTGLTQDIRLRRVTKAELSHGSGAVANELVMGGLHRSQCDTVVDLAIRCDGRAFAALPSNYYGLPGCESSQHLTVHEISLGQKAVTATRTTYDDGGVHDIDATCKSDEIYGASWKCLELGNCDGHVEQRFWRMSVSPTAIGPPEVVESQSSNSADPFTVTVGGSFAKLLYKWTPVLAGTAVEPCQAAGLPTTAQALPCPECELEVLPPTAQTPTTTRWKPMRNDGTPVVIRFSGPSDLDVAAKAALEATRWGGSMVHIPNLDIVANGACAPGLPSCEYQVTWTMLWTYPDGTHLPAANYDIVVKATAGTAPSQRPVRSMSYGPVSLVEVKSVEILTSPGTATYPEISENNIPNTGGGLNAYVDAESSGGVHRNIVRVRATIEPALDGAATDVVVGLRRIDVDDPYIAPAHVTGAARYIVDDDSGTSPSLVDNRGDDAAAIVALAVVNDSDYVEFEMPLSTVQGDNYRFIASTDPQWTIDAEPIVPSLLGEVEELAYPGQPLPEGKQVSPMLTIWRTLHVEVATFIPGTVPGDGSLDAPTQSWTQLSSHELTDSTVNFTLVTPNPPTNRAKANLWRGASVSPANDGVIFPVTGNGTSNLSTGGGDMCGAVPATYCTTPPVDAKYREYYLRDDEVLASLAATCDPNSACYCGGPGSGCSTQQLLEWVLEPVLATACIRLESVEAAVPFVRALDLDMQRQMKPAAPSSYAWWNILVPLAFDPGWQYDHDPTLERDWSNGVMLKGSGWAGNTVAYIPIPPPLPPGTSYSGDQVVAATFRETIRDFYETGASCIPHPTVPRVEMVASNVAHEVLHGLRLFHTGDGSGGLMCSAYKNNGGEAHRLEVTELQRAHLRGAPGGDGFVLAKPFVSLGVYEEAVSGCALEIQGGC